MKDLTNTEAISILENLLEKGKQSLLATNSMDAFISLDKQVKAVKLAIIALRQQDE